MESFMVDQYIVGQLVTSLNFTWAAFQTRCRMCRDTSSSWRAAVTRSEVRNRQKVLCTG